MFLTRWLHSFRPASRPLHRPASHRRRPAVEILEGRTLLSVALVRDINTDSLGSDPFALTNVGGTIFFSANDGFSGKELYKSDGTASGTVRVKDINPGGAGSVPANLTNVNGTLFFTADDGVHGQELWKSDGTEAGTVLVKDIRPGSASAFQFQLIIGAPPTLGGSLTNANGTLFFIAGDDATGLELWKSDGTEAGTVLVKDITPGPSTTQISPPAHLTAVGATLFFSAHAEGAGRELWKSDGTEAGTVLVKDIAPGPAGSNLASLVNVSGTLFFKASDGVVGGHGEELWKSDGTPAGTVLVVDFRPGIQGISPTHLTNVNGTLFFSGELPFNNRELFKSDGTEEGTVVVKDIFPGNTSSNPQQLTNVSGTVFFIASDNPSRGRELWKSDGTEEGTVLVKDIWPGSSTSDAVGLVNVNDTLFFIAAGGSFRDRELWKSDGTETGTVRVKDVYPGTFGSFPPVASSGLAPQLVNVSGTLFFQPQSPRFGHELWKSDGTEAGTVLVKDINTKTEGSDPSEFVNFNGTLFFAADDRVNGTELWRSDGTTAGTVLVKDLRPGMGNVGPLETNPSPLSSYPNQLTVVGDTLFFTAQTGPGLFALWKSDGTTDGTVLVQEFGTWPDELTNLNGTLLFAANDGVNGQALWRSDGTPAGTVLVKDVSPLTTGRPLRDLIAVNGLVFFRANDGVAGQELWKSDGTAEGTVLVMDIRPGSAGAFGNYVAYVASVNGTLYFTADDGVHGSELWRSDGTAAGTFLVKDIRPGSLSGVSGPGSPFQGDLNGTFFFRANDGVAGEELWKSDGTEAGTVMVRDINPGTSSSTPQALALINGTVYFAAVLPDIGRGLWKSDGTEAGTVLIREINRDPASPVQYAPLLSFTNVNGTIYFVAQIGSFGIELWRTDGTTAGTVLVQDINPGPAAAFLDFTPPPSLTNVNGTLFFAARDGVHGFEVMKVQGPAGNQPPVLGPIADQIVNEGSPLTFTITATDPDAGQTLTFSLVSGPAGASIDPNSGVFTWTPDDGPASVTVTVRVTDNGDPALSDTRTFTITVLNGAPTPGVSGPSSGTVGQVLSFMPTASDPSTADQAAGFTYVIDWGDGSPLQTVDAFPDSGAGVVVSHAYAAPGAYVVRVTAIDKDGGAGTAVLAEPVMIASVPVGVSDLSWSGGGILAPPPVAAGEAFTISRTFAVGGEPVGPFTIAYWASVDDIFGNEDDFLVGVELIAGAAPGIHSGTSPAFTVTAPGTYFLFAVLDSNGQVNEIDEGNNVAVALFPLLVSELADDEEQETGAG